MAAMSSYRREQWTMITASLMVLATVALGFVLWFTRSVMIPFVLAVFVVAVVAPLADWLEVRARFRRWMSIITVLLLVMSVAVMAVFLLTYTAFEVGQSIDRYTRIVIQMIADSLERSEEVLDKSATARPDNSESPPATRPDSPDELDAGTSSRSDAVDKTKPQPTADAKTAKRDPGATTLEASPQDIEVASADEAATPFFNAERVRSWLQRMEQELSKYLTTFAQSVLGSAARVFQTILSTFVFMTIFLLFLLAARDPGRLKHGVYADIEAQIRHYLTIKLAVSAVTGVLVALILWLMNVELALVFGVLTFLLNFIPSVGSIIATFLPLPIACAQYILEPIQASESMNLWMVAAVLLGPGAVQMIIGNVVEPRIMGEGLQLDPIVILIALAKATVSLSVG